ncbi:hypothetical protein [Microbispora triticiradicis]|uniref:hypothetical protein n=1 Tax=Microbispora triticiradicis TaxID=2200763 RepID=UPI0010588CE2|nr:hypothetical protein [Microbispora triticiradicis]
MTRGEAAAPSAVEAGRNPQAGYGLGGELAHELRAGPDVDGADGKAPALRKAKKEKEIRRLIGGRPIAGGPIDNLMTGARIRRVGAEFRLGINSD